MLFDDRMNIRLRQSEIERINKIVEKNHDYNGVSHFVRCAVIKLLREEEVNKQ